MNFDQSSSYSKEDRIDCGNGELFGPKNGRLPVNEMLMFDRIELIDIAGGKYGKGKIVALLDINPNLWFFDVHFRTDPVMPGWFRIGCYVAIVRIFSMLVKIAWLWKSARCR